MKMFNKLLKFSKTKYIPKSKLRGFVKKWQKTADYYLTNKQYKERAEILEMLKELKVILNGGKDE